MKSYVGRNRGKNDDRQYRLCGNECVNVVHVLWECPVYATIRNTSMGELDNLLGGVLKSLVHSIILREQLGWRFGTGMIIKTS